jgi:predicted RNA-binding protein YlxR (DUF448 family)
MIRVARVKDNFVVDKTHRAGGRGCHICPNCIEKAIKNRALNRSFRRPVGDEVYNELKDISVSNEKTK